MQRNPFNEDGFTFTKLASSQNTTETQYAVSDLKEFKYLIITYGGQTSPLYSMEFFRTSDGGHIHQTTTYINPTRPMRLEISEASSITTWTSLTKTSAVVAVVATLTMFL